MPPPSTRMGAASNRARARSQDERVPGGPYAGVNRIRFEGCNLSPAAVPDRNRTPPCGGKMSSSYVKMGGGCFGKRRGECAPPSISHTRRGWTAGFRRLRSPEPGTSRRRTTACIRARASVGPRRPRTDPACWVRAGPGPACWAHGASGSAHGWAGTAGVAGCAEAGAAAAGVGCAGGAGPQASRSSGERRSLGERRSWQKGMFSSEVLRKNVYKHVPDVLSGFGRCSHASAPPGFPGPFSEQMPPALQRVAASVLHGKTSEPRVILRVTPVSRRTSPNKAETSSFNTGDKSGFRYDLRDSSVAELPQNDRIPVRLRQAFPIRTFVL